MLKKNLSQSWLDRLGLSLSAICAAHCLLLPIVIFFLPFARQGSHDHSFHEIVIWMTLGIVAILLIRSLRLKLSPQTKIAMGIGLLFLLCGHFLESRENEVLGSTVTVLGSACLGWVHYRNLRSHQHCSMRVLKPDSAESGFSGTGKFH